MGENRSRTLCGAIIALLLLATPPAWAEEETVAPGDTDWNGRTSLELGATFGMPHLLGPTVGLWSGRVGMNVTGMYWSPDIHGFQLAPGYRFVNPTRGEHRVALLAGRMRFDDAAIDTVYVGPAYQFHAKYGFFFEGGLVAAPGYSGIPQIWFQLGWVGRIQLPMDPLL